MLEVQGSFAFFFSPPPLSIVVWVGRTYIAVGKTDNETILRSVIFVLCLGD